MTERTEIKQLFKNYQEWNGRVFHVTGWVRTIRSSSAIGFIELNDGSYFRNVQVVFENDK
jgi:asparaginyl-tRNA synthetase